MKNFVRQRDIKLPQVFGEKLETFYIQFAQQKNIIKVFLLILNKKSLDRQT